MRYWMGSSKLLRALVATLAMFVWMGGYILMDSTRSVLVSFSKFLAGGGGFKKLLL